MEKNSADTTIGSVYWWS